MIILKYEWIEMHIFYICVVYWFWPWYTFQTKIEKLNFSILMGYFLNKKLNGNRTTDNFHISAIQRIHNMHVPPTYWVLLQHVALWLMLWFKENNTWQLMVKQRILFVYRLWCLRLSFHASKVTTIQKTKIVFILFFLLIRSWM